MEKRRTITIQLAVVAIAITSMPWTTLAQEQPRPGIDLRRALDLARSNNPALKVARHRIAEAEGDLLGASLLLANNPEISGVTGPRFGSTAGADLTLDLEIGLEQSFELGGQRGHRVAWAEAQKRVSEVGVEDARRVLDLAVALAFYDLVAAKRRVEIREEGQQLAIRLFEVATRRLKRGAGTPLELNTARIRRAEAQRRLVAAQATKRSSQLLLRGLLALPANHPLSVQGDLPDAQLAEREDGLVAEAVMQRPDLRATAHRVEAALADVELADAEVFPKMAIGVSYGREEDNNIVLGGVRFSIPIFNRNQGPRHRARATLGRLRAEQSARRLAVESEVRRAYTDYMQASSALRLYDAEVLRAQEEILSLLQRAFEAGEVGYSDLIVVQREALEGREGLLDVRLKLARARAALLAAAGFAQLPDL